jgi:hypothetical protein
MKGFGKRKPVRGGFNFETEKPNRKREGFKI